MAPVAISPTATSDAMPKHLKAAVTASSGSSENKSYVRVKSKPVTTEPRKFQCIFSNDQCLYIYYSYG